MHWVKNLKLKALDLYYLDTVVNSIPTPVLDGKAYVLINQIINTMNNIHDDKEQQYETKLEDVVAKFMIYLLYLYYTLIKNLIFI